MFEQLVFGGWMQFSHQSNTGNCRYSGKNPASSESQLELASALPQETVIAPLLSQHPTLPWNSSTCRPHGAATMSPSEILIIQFGWQWVKTSSHFLWGKISIYKGFDSQPFSQTIARPDLFTASFSKGRRNQCHPMSRHRCTGTYLRLNEQFDVGKTP